MSDTRQIATVRNSRELCDAFRARVDELNISLETLDHIAGLPIRYSAKLLAPVPLKSFGPMSLDSMLGGLALKLGVFVDDEQLAKVKDRMVKRGRSTSLSDPMHSNTVHIKISGRKLKRAQRKGGANSRKFVGKRMAKKLARKAARARWHKPVIVEVKGSDAVTLRADVAAPCEAQCSAGKPGTP